MTRPCDIVCTKCGVATDHVIGALVPGGKFSNSYRVCWKCNVFTESRVGAEWFRFTKKHQSPWTKFTPYHWRREVNGSPLDYWPTKSKWKYCNVFHKGDVDAFIARVTNK